MSDGMRVPIDELMRWVLESLKRSGYKGLDGGMHPEDWAAAIIPAIEAVGIGFSEGYHRGRNDERKRQG